MNDRWKESHVIHTKVTHKNKASPSNPQYIMIVWGIGYKFSGISHSDCPFSYSCI